MLDVFSPDTRSVCTLLYIYDFIAKSWAFPCSFHFLPFSFFFLLISIFVQSCHSLLCVNIIIFGMCYSFPARKASNESSAQCLNRFAAPQLFRMQHKYNKLNTTSETSHVQLPVVKGERLPFMSTSLTSIRLLLRFNSIYLQVFDGLHY